MSLVINMPHNKLSGFLSAIPEEIYVSVCLIEGEKDKDGGRTKGS